MRIERGVQNRTFCPQAPWMGLRRPGRCAFHRLLTGMLSLLFGCGRKLRVLQSAASNVIPRCLGVHENMHVDLDARITVDSTESYPMHLIFMSSADRASTGATEAEPPSRRRLIVREVFGTADP